MGGVTGRMERWMAEQMETIAVQKWYLHLLLFPVAIAMIMLAMSLTGPISGVISARFAVMDGLNVIGSVVPTFAVVFICVVMLSALLAIGLSGGMLGFLAFCSVFTRLGRGGRWVASRMFRKAPDRIHAGYRRNAFGRVIEFIAGNPVMPLVVAGVVFVFVGTVMIFFGNNSKGVEFFVESEPEQAIVYVLARGNLGLEEKDDLLRKAEEIVIAHPGVQTAFSFAGQGGLDSNTGGAQAPKDSVGQIQFETIPWEDRPNLRDVLFTIPLIGYEVVRETQDPAFDGDVIIAELTEQLEQIPGIRIEVLAQARGPASAKPVHLRLKSDSFVDLVTATALARDHFDTTPGLTLIEDTRPLPGIDWQIDVDVEKAGRYGADVLTVGAMVQLVTRGLLLDTMRVDSSDEEIDIRVRLPKSDRVLSTLDTLKVRTPDGLVPLSNFITRTPVPKLAEITRVDQKRHLDIKAGVGVGLMKLVQINTVNGVETQETFASLRPAAGDTDFTSLDGTAYKVTKRTELGQGVDLQALADSAKLRLVPINANERITQITEWLDTKPLPFGVSYEWTGDQEDQAESQAFLSSAFSAALGLMFIILLAQFNSVYNAALVLLAVVLSTTGVLIGMLVMDQTFSIIMTGTGIVALAGIVVNNNIILIDTYQEYERYMPRIEAIIRTAQARIRPVLLTTITTMAGLAPMMFGLSLNFADGGYTIDSPTALWWKQLATAVVFGLGIATFLTLLVTPSMLAIRVWATTYVHWVAQLLAKLSLGRASKAAQDWALQRDARRGAGQEIIWGEDFLPPSPLPKVAKPTPAE
jgi:multidrug efflux pump